MLVLVRCCDCQQYHPFIEAPSHGYCFELQCEMRHDDFCSRGIRSEETFDEELLFDGVRNNSVIAEYLEASYKED